MRIFYICAIERNAGWGAETFMNRALRAAGHETYPLDFRVHRWRLSRAFLLTPPFDALFLQRGDDFPVPLVEACPGPRVFWASELVRRRADQRHLLKSGLFDHLFVRTPRCREEVVSAGWASSSQVSVLLSAFDEGLHRPLPDVRPDLDVVFVGTPTPRRERILERLGRTHRVTVARGHGERMVELFNRARIVLNLHAEDHLDTETRVFEALGCGAFLLSEPLSEESPFRSGVHLVEAEGPEALTERIAHYLARPDERTEIARRGHAFARERHTYAARARQVVGVLEAARSAARDHTPRPVDAARVRAFARREPAVNVVRLLRRAGRKARSAVERLSGEGTE